MQRTILVTGFPGFIATKLIPKLLADEPEAKVVALVEPRMLERAKEVAARELGTDRVGFLLGDITRPRLGLEEGDHASLTAQTVAVHHLAAVYDLAVGADLAERVNVAGTGHVVDFCRACERLERHNYVSTAYTAGWRSGLVREEELACGQRFKNHYESTKFAAEVVVRLSMDDVPTTIYRPAIVVGDSQTGATQKFDGPYYMLRTISASRGPLPQVGNPEALFNTVPVDFVVDAIAAGARDEQAIGLTLHLTDPDPLPSSEVFRLLAAEYDGRTPGFHVPPGVLDTLMRSGAVRRMYGGTPRESLAYLNHPVRFDTTNAEAVLGRQGLRVPRFAQYVGPMVRFFREHEDDDALRPAHER